MLRACAMQQMRVIRLVDGDRPATGGALWTVPDSGARADPLTRDSSAGRAIIDRETIHIHDLAAMPQANFRRASERRSVWAVGQCSPRHCCEKAFRLGRLLFAAPRFVLSPTSRSHFSRLSPTQAVIAIENVRLFKEFRSATQNCARRWSIRRRQPRCSASSAARRRTCSRCSTPSSRAPRGFVGLMMWCCDSAKGTSGFAGSFWFRYPFGRDRDQYGCTTVSLDA